jgi:hypothetical protein
MAMNLVDALTAAGERRRFSLPLAAIPPGRNSVRAVDRTRWQITETAPTLPAPDGRTSDVALRVRCSPVGGFPNEDGLPDPLIRLHAIDVGMITFRPADAALRASLILQTPTFGEPLHTATAGGVKWWRRWIEAGCIPQTIVYENVDPAQLRTLLEAVVAPPDALFEHRVPPTLGVQFPAGVTNATKAGFIAQFLAGAAGHFVVADVGAFIGVAARAPGAADDTRELGLHVRYHDHTDANPHPMSPRELFHLLFGNDSDEASNHPLLRRIDELGQAQILQPETLRMLLRPPLRTSFRVVWEADQERDNHSANWRPAGSLGTNRFFNNHQRAGRTFNDGDYGPPPAILRVNKCNLFISDICLRAGFRVCMHPVGANRWHYLDANSYTNLVHRGAGPEERVALQGRAEDRLRTWGLKFENWLRAQPANDRQRLLNEAITDEGRCFILAGARARRFRPHALPGGVQGIADCGTALRRDGIGHIVIVGAVLNEPVLAPVVGEGLRSIRVLTAEASGAGAVGRAFNAALGGAAGAAAAGTGFIRLHLVELHPGKDPGTVQGLRDLNVHNVNLNLLGVANEAAADARRTHNADGSVRPPPPAAGRCCQDQHPPRDAAPAEVDC